MGVLFWIALSILVDMVVGVIVLDSMDKDGSFNDWYMNCTPQISWIAQPAILILWPVIAWIMLRKNKASKKQRGA